MPPRGRTGGPRRRLDRRALTARRADEAGQRAQGRGPVSPAGNEARRRSTEGTRRQGSALSGPQRQQAAGGASQRAQGLGAASPTGDEARRRSAEGTRGKAARIAARSSPASTARRGSEEDGSASAAARSEPASRRRRRPASAGTRRCFPGRAMRRDGEAPREQGGKAARIAAPALASKPASERRDSALFPDERGGSKEGRQRA
jgi:hypothetical protein